MPPSLATALLLVLVLTCFAGLLAGIWCYKPPAHTYIARPLLTQTELDFYTRLRHALPEYLVLPQIALSALMSPCPTRRRAYRTALARISPARVGYVIADRIDVAVVALVELSDPSSAEIPDLDPLTASVGYTLHRFDVAQRPSPPAIREQILGPSSAEVVPFPRSEPPL